MRLTHALAAIGVGVVLLTSCGGDDDSSSDTTEQPSGTETTSSAADTTEGSAVTPPDDGGPSVATLTDGEAPAERTFTITANSFAPESLTVQAGETFTFKATDGMHAVIVDGGDGATVTGGLIETFVIEEPGTYEILCDLHSDMTATITVT